MQPKPSEIWTFESPTAPKGKMKSKHHLCIACEGIFLFVSTHRRRRQDHRGVMIIPNDAVPCLPPTETGKSEISCTTIIRRAFPDPNVRPKNLRCNVSELLMKDLVRFVENSRQLTADERDAIVDYIYDYYGIDFI